MFWEKLQEIKKCYNVRQYICYSIGDSDKLKYIMLDSQTFLILTISVN